MCGHLAVSGLSAERLPIDSKLSTSKTEVDSKKKKRDPAFDAVKYHSENVQGIIKVKTLFGG